MSAGIIDYEVIACSSEDEEMQRYVASLKDLQVVGNKVCWVTEKKRSYPQSLTILLKPPQSVGRVDVVVHPKLIPSSVTVAFGISSRGGGRANDAKYTIKGSFQFLVNGIVSERQTLYCEDQAEYIRFTAHGYYDNGENDDRQICIAAIVIRAPGNLFGETNTRGNSPADDLMSRSITTIRNPVLDEKMRASPVKRRTPSPKIRTPSPTRAPSRALVSPFDPQKHGIKLNPAIRGNSPTRRSPLPIPIQPPLMKRRPSPVPAPTLPKANLQHLINSDSEDEEVIFTKSMVQRLKGKIKDQEGDTASTSERPSSTGSKTPTRSASRGSRSSSKNGNDRPDSVQIRRPLPLPKEDKELRIRAGTPELDSKSEKSADSGAQSLDRPLSPRSRDRILREIAGIEIGDGKLDKKDKRYYFKRSMNVYNNTLRILESRKEECLYKEEYSAADAVQQQLEKLYAKEAPLRELLIERLDALQATKYKQAQRLKDKFDAQLEDAVDLEKLRPFFTKAEISKLEEMQRKSEDGVSRD